MGKHGDPIAQLVRVTAASICEVILVSFVGYILARRGILDKPTTTKINKINVSIFTPALLFSKVAFSLNAHRLVELAVVPIGFVLVELVSLLAALFLSKIACISSAHTRYAIAVAITPNSNSLPVALMQSLVVTVPLLRWDEPGEPPDDPNSMIGRALTYLVLFSTLGMFVRWSIGAHLLSTAGTSLAHGPRSTLPDPEHTHPHPHPPRWAVSFPNTPADSDASDTSSRAASPTPDHQQQQQQQPPPPPPPTTTPRSSCATRLIVRPARAVYAFMTAPLWAAILSLGVALVPPVQRLLSSIGPLRGALDQCGACSIPLTLVALGAYFVEHKPPPPAQPIDHNHDNPQTHAPSARTSPTVGGDAHLTVPTSRGPSRPESVASTAYADSESSGAGARLKRLGWSWRRTGAIRLEDEDRPREQTKWGMSESARTIAAAIGARMIVCPLILIPPMAYIAIKTRNNVMDDPVFLASACLIVGSPPALTLAQITTQTAQKAGRGDAGAVERLISRTIFVAYTILATPTTIVLVLVALLIAEND